jgi:hypothetical protein
MFIDAYTYTYTYIYRICMYIDIMGALYLRGGGRALGCGGGCGGARGFGGGSGANICGASLTTNLRKKHSAHQTSALRIIGGESRHYKTKRTCVLVQNGPLAWACQVVHPQSSLFRQVAFPHNQLKFMSGWFITIHRFSESFFFKMMRKEILYLVS